MAQRILADGSVLGCYHDDDFPNSAINERGQIAGTFVDENGTRRAFVANRSAPD